MEPYVTSVSSCMALLVACTCTSRRPHNLPGTYKAVHDLTGSVPNGICHRSVGQAMEARQIMIDRVSESNLNDLVGTMPANFLLVAARSPWLSPLQLPQSPHALHPV